MERDHERELRTAAQVAERLGHMKGVLMKVGQMASHLDATGPYRRISEEIWPFRQGPPATPMREAEAAWFASRSST